MNERKFCPNCGAKIKADATFCPSCGTKLTKQEQSKQEYRTKSLQASAPKTVPVKQQVQVRQRRAPMKKRNKIILISLLVIVALGGAFYSWGSNHFQRNNQVAQLTAYLKNPQQNLADYVMGDDPDMHVTAAALKPTQKYYAEHSNEADKIADALKYSDNYNNVKLVESGHYLLIFPKYKLQFKTFAPHIETNHANSTIFVNGKKIGGVDGSGEDYYKKVTPLFPGKYHIAVKSIASGHKLAANKNVDIFSNQAINMDIKTVNFMIKSIPKATVYINDEQVGVLNNNGTKTFNDYPVINAMKIYVETKVDGKMIRSETINYDDLGFADDDDSEDNVVKPSWKGLIDKKEAEQILADNFNSPDEDNFIGGAENKSYQDLHTQSSNFADDDDIIDTSMECSVVSIMPAPNNSSSVTYKITYTFEHEDFEHKQVLLYTGGLFHRVGDEDDDDAQKIRSIGNGKVISDKKYNN